jgi:MoaA/NifB/PqqE/SkfB family radical SAM enzyme
MSLLKGHRIPFGFSAVHTRSTSDILICERFIDTMVDAGCAVGFFNDFIPAGPDEMDLVPDAAQVEQFKESVADLRREKPIVIVHLPHDEYDKEDLCMAVQSGVFHVNSQGFAEPCPFAHFALDNIRTSSFDDILRSPFLEAIRRHPAVTKCGEIGCSLANNREVLKEIARSTGAGPTR